MAGPTTEPAGHIDRPEPPLSLVARLRAQLEERGVGPTRLIATLVAALAAVVVGWWLLRPPPAPIEASLPVETQPTGRATLPAAGLQPAVAPAPSSTTDHPTAIVAHAAGAVARPGLYRLRPGARVADLVAAAGGLAAGADGDRLNLADPLDDGERVYVLRGGEAEVPTPVEGDHGSSGGVVPDAGPATDPSGPQEPVDINRADAAQLDTLPGVGPATAQAIIAYRTEHGRFTSVDDLLDVHGIGDAKLAQLRDLVRV